ncbi:aldehyde dehydrogenase [Mycobacterium malmoense]|uniref:aldehyde dehydrogenase n=1 Tax=Mycobacterium malmoense TaxID=1780 RepID=UPI00080B541A|nr:aldehyde dehydrogenase [Mycobacterium malmoense]OCB19272.1 aldehyde dehydrogenase [Mycobacterium malmoense]
MQHLVSARTHADAVAKAADTLGVDLPAPYRQQIAQAQAFNDAANQIGATTGDLHGAVFSVIENGRDYHDDPNVARLLLDRVLSTQNVGESARCRGDELLAAALADHGDDILAGWADALDEHSDALAAAAEAVPGLNLADGRAAGVKGGEVLRHWATARSALEAWQAAERGWFALATVASIRYSGHGPLILTPARKGDLEPAYQLARNERTDVDAWVLARCGIPLRLATIAEFMSRVAQYNADRQAEDRAREQRRVEAGFNR